MCSFTVEYSVSIQSTQTRKGPLLLLSCSNWVPVAASHRTISPPPPSPSAHRADDAEPADPGGAAGEAGRPKRVAVRVH